MLRSKTAGVWILAAAFGCQPSEGTTPGADTVGAVEDGESMAQLRVQVFYRERVMVPPTSTLEVVLENGAKMDASAELVAKVEVSIKTGPPYDATLEYDPKTLHPKGRYGVRARIENDGRLLFTSTQYNAAFGVTGSPAEPTNDPVKVLLSQVPSTRAPSGASITGTRWALESLSGKPTGPGAGGRAPDLTLQGSEPLASGFAGCNQISGGYTLASQKLSFGQIAMTMRECADGMGLERDFAKALRETRGYRIEGDTLSLLDENEKVVAVFKAG